MYQVTKYVDFSDAPSAKANDRARIDAERYTTPGYMKREWEQVWTQSWLLAGIACDIPESGDYFVFDIGRESIVVARTERGEINAFYNVCQHRGNKLVFNERGTVSSFTCPYHNWTYKLDGSLISVPDEERFSQGVPCDELSLKSVKVDTWDGLVFIAMNPDVEPLGKFLGVMADNLKPYNFEDMILVKDQTVCLDANWKTVIDNFSELYHVDYMHPQHASFVDCRDAIVELWPYGHTGVMVEGYVVNPRYGVPDEPPDLLKMQLKALGLNPDDFKGRVDEIRKAVQKQKRIVGKEVGFDYSGFSDEQVSDVWQYNLFPNVVMTIKPEELWVMRPRPHPTDPDKCLFDKWTLQIRPDKAKNGSGLTLVGDVTDAVSASKERPEHEVFTQDEVIAGNYSMTITIDQDIHYLRDMQAGMHSRGFERAWINDDESRVQHFHDWLDIWIEHNPVA